MLLLGIMLSGSGEGLAVPVGQKVSMTLNSTLLFPARDISAESTIPKLRALHCALTSFELRGSRSNYILQFIYNHSAGKHDRGPLFFT